MDCTDSPQTCFDKGLSELDYASSTNFGDQPMPCRLGTYELSPMQVRAAAALLNAYQRALAPELFVTFPFGSGKTLISLAVAAQILRGAASRAGYEILPGQAPDKMPGFHAQERLYVNIPRKAVRNIVIVFARTATVAQWMKHLQNAGLRAARATTWLEFHTRFKVELVAPGGAPWEVVVVRDGHISTLPDSNRDSITTVRAVEMTMRAAGCAAQLVIYDDYDKGIHSMNEGVPACAALLVSGTAVGGELRPRTVLSPAMRTLTPTSLVARGAPVELDADMKVPSLRVLVAVFDNPDDRFAAMLGDLAGEAVAEMLNGMACETAARTLGIDTRSPATMFKVVLKQRYTEWIDGQKAEKYLGTVDEVLAHARIGYFHRDEETQYIATCRHLLQRSIAALGRESCERPHVERQFPHQHTTVTEIVARRSAEVRARVAECNESVERFRTRISEGECVICSEMEFPEGFFVTNCCFSVLCGKCLAHGTHQQGKSAVGRCPSCRNLLNYRTNMLFIAGDVDVEQLINGQPEPEPEPETAAPPVDDWQHLPPKLMALNYIIRGQPIPASAANCFSLTEMQLNVANVLGHGNAPTAAGPPAVLVFASYDESLSIIQENIKDFCRCAVLPRGSSAHEIIDQFNSGAVQVLLICSQRDCAGLDLQHATDIVFFNEFTRVTEFAQSVGRVQRFGRNNVAARCHILAFRNEQSLVQHICTPLTERAEFPLYADAAPRASAAQDHAKTPDDLPPNVFRMFCALARRLKLAFPGQKQLKIEKIAAGQGPSASQSHPVHQKISYLAAKYPQVRQSGALKIPVDLREATADYNDTISKKEHRARRRNVVAAAAPAIPVAPAARAPAEDDPDYAAHQAALENEPDEDVRRALRASYELFVLNRQA